VTRIAFGDFVLDSDTHELLRAERAVHLSPKAFQLLEALVANRPRALSKEELHDRLWPDSFVVEANLANLVASIRAALGDDPRHPQYIRTVQRFGYAFQAEAKGAVPASALPRAGAAFRVTWKGGRAVLVEGDHIVGRDPGLALSFDSTTVSRRHARIRIAGDEATIEDLESKNGTFVNDRRVGEATRLADGDEIRVGSLRLKFRRLAASAATETATSSR
jgi:DNA-binding winged helix-turn-helix (wHTH) protein